MKELLRVEAISKSFYGNKVLQQVDFTLAKGEVLAIVGENGAGKSTLMKILAGVHQPDEGSIFIEGHSSHFSNTKEARQSGIGIIYQELSLVPQLSVAENIFLGEEIHRMGWVDWDATYKRAAEVLQRLGLEVDPRTKCGELSVGKQQMVEIARAASADARIMIMDEPTAVLNRQETLTLFELVRRMKSQGMGIIYISHRLDEVFQLADRIMVLRDGQQIITERAENLTRDEIIYHMVGRQINDMYPRENHTTGRVLLQTKNLTVPGVLDKISFALHAGEILGVAGLMGCGKEELGEALFGSFPYQGEILVNQDSIELTSPSSAISRGIGLVPEDRKAKGLVVGLSTRENLSLPNLGNITSWGFVSRAAEWGLTRRLVERLRIRVHDENMPVRFLSGGNQQKVVLGKWVERDSTVLILSEPTRGIDVGARTEIYRLMNELTKSGKGILLISSDLPEVLGMSDRVLVMRDGQIAAELDAREASQEKVMHFAIGGDE